MVPCWRCGPKSLLTEYASANIETFLDRPATDCIGRPLAELIGADNVEALSGRALEPIRPDILKPWFLDVGVKENTRQLECFPHRRDDMIILEFVPYEAGPALIWEEDLLRQRIISELIRPDTLSELARIGAQIVREVTGFDRVMIYRFAADKHGEVIAESTSREDSFLGQHYPASDIPDPARRHFALNVIRSIPDINAVPSPILARGGGVADAEHPRSARPHLFQAARRSAGPYRVSEQHGRRRLHVDFADLERRSVGGWLPAIIMVRCICPGAVSASASCSAARSRRCCRASKIPCSCARASALNGRPSRSKAVSGRDNP